MGQLPKFVGDDWKPAVAAHVRAQMRPAAEGSREGRRQGSAETTSQSIAERTAEGTTQSTPESSEWPETKDIDKAVLRRMVRDSGGPVGA
jgi:hypothetical protein